MGNDVKNSYFTFSIGVFGGNIIFSDFMILTFYLKLIILAMKFITRYGGDNCITYQLNNRSSGYNGYEKYFIFQKQEGILSLEF